MANDGKGGALMFAIGGWIIFALLYDIITRNPDYLYNLPSPVVLVVGFVGFALLGLGLLAIVQSEKPETKLNPS